MKTLVFLVTLLYSGSLLASHSDTLFQRHQISFGMTDAISHQFFDTYRGASSWSYQRPVVLQNPEGGLARYSLLYTPNYGLHLNVNYSIGISRHFRVETGIGYMLMGYILTDRSMTASQAIRLYESAISVPLHFKFIKQMKKGRFTCTLGPDFFFPVQAFSNYDIVSTQYSTTVHRSNKHVYTQRYDAGTTMHYSSLGCDLRMGYEHRVSDRVAINIGPVVSFTNLLPFSRSLRDSYAQSELHPYKYYIGLDVAVILGWTKK